MSVSLEGNAIHVSGPGRVEDAETLVVLLQADRTRVIDLTRAGALHTAVLQVLLAFRPVVVGPAGDAFVETWLTPLMVQD